MESLRLLTPLYVENYIGNAPKSKGIRKDTIGEMAPMRAVRASNTRGSGTNNTVAADTVVTIPANARGTFHLPHRGTGEWVVSARTSDLSRNPQQILCGYNSPEVTDSLYALGDIPRIDKLREHAHATPDLQPPNLLLHLVNHILVNALAPLDLHDMNCSVRLDLPVCAASILAKFSSCVSFVTPAPG